MSKRGKELIASRPSTHGPFDQIAKTSGKFAAIAASAPNHAGMSDTKKMALGEIFHKIARILWGDPNHIDHWDDVGGYAELGAQDCRQAQPTVSLKRARRKAKPKVAKKKVKARPVRKAAKRPAARRARNQQPAQRRSRNRTNRVERRQRAAPIAAAPTVQRTTSA